MGVNSPYPHLSVRQGLVTMSKHMFRILTGVEKLEKKTNDNTV